MAFTSGIRASGSGSSEYTKKIVLKDSITYGPWRTKLTAILETEDSLEIVNGTELEPVIPKSIVRLYQDYSVLISKSA